MSSGFRKSALLIALDFFHRLPPGLKLWLRSFKRQEAEVSELKRLVIPSTIAVDVGANKGAYTFALAKLVGPTGRVLAVEPIHELAQYLKAACRQLHLPVDVEECCLSSTDTTGELFIPADDQGTLQTGLATLSPLQPGPGVTRPVVVRRLDSMLKKRDKRISFIKCDVEGHEIEVFLGAEEILSQDRPNLLVEIEQRHHRDSIENCFSFFEARGYRAYLLEDGLLRPLDELRVVSHQTLALKDCATQKWADAFNFIFLPEQSLQLRHKQQTGL